jgi:hypothetical protein
MTAALGHGKLKKFRDLIGTRTSDLPKCPCTDKPQKMSTGMVFLQDDIYIRVIRNAK